MNKLLLSLLMTGIIGVYCAGASLAASVTVTKPGVTLNTNQEETAVQKTVKSFKQDVNNVKSSAKNATVQIKKETTTTTTKTMGEWRSASDKLKNDAKTTEKNLRNEWKSNSEKLKHEVKSTESQAKNELKNAENKVKSSSKSAESKLQNNADKIRTDVENAKTEAKTTAQKQKALAKKNQQQRNEAFDNFTNSLKY